MDPNTVLAKMRQLAVDMHNWEERGEDPEEPGEYYRIASEMVEAFDTLDGWLARGGIRPNSWTRHLPPVERRTLAMERRIHRLRAALREAGVSENFVRAIELGWEEDLAPVDLSGNAREEKGQVQPEGLPQGVYREGEDL